MKIIHWLAVIALLLALVSGPATAQYIYPSVAFEFVPSSFAYVYTITVTPENTFPFGYAQLDTLVKNAGPGTWTMLGPVVGGSDVAWSTDWAEWAPGCDSAIWFADESKGQQAVNPSNWVGVFTLVAPGTEPRSGFGLTMAGDEESVNPFTVNVPGPVEIGTPIPEPSSLIALVGGALGLAGSLVRRRGV